MHFLGLGVLLFLLYGRLPIAPQTAPMAGELQAWLPPYVIGTVAMFWVIERIGAFV